MITVILTATKDGDMVSVGKVLKEAGYESDGWTKEHNEWRAVFTLKGVD